MQGDNGIDNAAILEDIVNQYPALKPHINNLNIMQSQDQNDGRQLEFYPPWEQKNPNPGRTTIELYNGKLQGKYLNNAIAGDMLHLLGSVDPRSGQQIDPNYYKMKQLFLQSITNNQLAVDQRTYREEKNQNPDTAPFDEWMQMNRGDAYIRGYITPDENDEWRRNNIYTDKQKVLLETMKAYLQGRHTQPNR